MIQNIWEHFEEVVEKEFLHIPRNLVSLTLLRFHIFFKKHVFEVLSANNAQNPDLEWFSVVKQHMDQVTH